MHMSSSSGGLLSLAMIRESDLHVKVSNFTAEINMLIGV